MALKSKLKEAVNRVLVHGNMRLETLTKERAESARLEGLQARSYFDQPVFALPKSFSSTAHERVLENLPQHSQRFDSFSKPDTNDVAYTFENGFYSSPDAEVLYTITRMVRPSRIAEVGSGNSTRLFRQAIRDGKLSATLTSIDPNPRADVTAIADQVHRCAVESLPSLDCFRELRENDILFIDSSHELKTGNDCVFLFLRVLPEIRPGVVVHIHDIFLPYDYPLEWAQTTVWAEQYLVQLLLLANPRWEVLWPAYYLAKTRRDLPKHFPHWCDRHACSLWFRVHP
jgi:predicted O-methyltransferase YrrM